MALVPATITVFFTSNYTGDHRVCWRAAGTTIYDCSTIVTCLGGGAACSVDITVTVNDSTCPASFEGYVQAVCEDIGSLTGRVAFLVTYTPVDACESVSYTCNQPECNATTVAVTDCGGANPLGLAKANLGMVANFCVPTGTVMPVVAGHTLGTSTTDCCTCVEVTFTNPNGDPHGYAYQDCTTRAQVLASLPVYSSVTVCAIAGTETTAYDSGITIAIGGSCIPTPIIPFAPGPGK